jgi:hypothetical protein
MLELSRTIEFVAEVSSLKSSANVVEQAFLERCLAGRSDMASKIWNNEFQPRVEMAKSRHGIEDSVHVLRDLSVEFARKYAEHLTEEEIDDTKSFSNFIDARDFFDGCAEGFKSLPKQLTIIKRLKKIRHLASTLASSIPECMAMVQGSRYEPEIVRLYLGVFKLLWNWSQPIKSHHIAPKYRSKSRPIQRETKEIIEVALTKIQNDYRLPYHSESAEGKAIHRIQDVEPVEWKVSHKPGDIIDLKATQDSLLQAPGNNALHAFQSAGLVGCLDIDPTESYQSAIHNYLDQKYQQEAL